MPNDSSPAEDSGIDRRTVLKGVGTATMGLAFGSTTAAARGGPPPGTGRGNPKGGPPSGTGRGNSGNGGGACHQDFTCNGEGTYVKFELDATDCEFVEETETGLIDVRVTDTKDGEECEPVAVEWTGSVSQVMAFGGRACETVSDPSGSYTSGLENGGGQTAAISNLQFCVVKGAASCVACDSEAELLVKYEWDTEEETFVPAGETDANITLDSVTLDDSDEAETACFSTDYCEVDAWVKAGTETERYPSQSGDFCVTGIDDHAISHVSFFCERTSYSPGNSEPAVGEEPFQIDAAASSGYLPR